jgi:hypothetical protein
MLKLDAPPPLAPPKGHEGLREDPKPNLRGRRPGTMRKRRRGGSTNAETNQQLTGAGPDIVMEGASGCSSLGAFSLLLHSKENRGSGVDASRQRAETPRTYYPSLTRGQNGSKVRDSYDGKGLFLLGLRRQWSRRTTDARAPLARGCGMVTFDM